MADYFLFDRIREGQGGREAIRSDDGSLTYDQVAALASGMGRQLQRLGVEPGQRVLIALPDGVGICGLAVRDPCDRSRRSDDQP